MPTARKPSPAIAFGHFDRIHKEPVWEALWEGLWEEMATLTRDLNSIGRIARNSAINNPGDRTMPLSRNDFDAVLDEMEQSDWNGATAAFRNVEASMSEAQLKEANELLAAIEQRHFNDN